MVERADSTSYPGLTWHCLYPRLAGGDSTARSRINDDVDALIDAAVAEFIQDYSGGPAEGVTSLTLELPTVWHEATETSVVIPDAVIQSPHTVSFTLVHCIGGNAMAHGFCEPRPLLYEVTTGRRLGLSDVLDPSTRYLEFLSALAYHDLSAQLLERRGSLEYYTGIDASGVLPAPDNFSRFTLSADSIHFEFPPYAVASYADGAFTLGVPLRALHAFILRTGPVGTWADSTLY